MSKIAKLQEKRVLNKRKIYNLEDEINYLCKLLKTSRPEQYIYTYIKQIFPNTVRGKRFEWLLCNSEFDIFIPDFNFAIEYDGIHWHEYKIGLSDSKKNKLAKENNITLFRVREAGLEEPDCNFYLYDYSKTYDNIDKPINAIINFINKKYNKKIRKIKELDFKLLKQETLKNLREEKRNQSIIGKWEEIEKYWNYKNNNGIMPEDVRVTHAYNLNVTCPYCKKEIKFIPRLSFYYYGKYSFTPHICEELDNYCIALLKEKCKNGNLELSMNNLDDRRLKDWLIRISKNIFFTTIKAKNLEKLEEEVKLKINKKNLYEKKIADYNDLIYFRNKSY